MAGPAAVRYTGVEYQSTNGGTPTMTIQIDPVCGMQVDDTTAQLSHEYEGVTYWFCGKGCLLDFRDDPETYLAPDQVPSA